MQEEYPLQKPFRPWIVSTSRAALAANASLATDARNRAAEAREDAQAFTGDIAAQNGRIDAVESGIGGLRGELAALEGKRARLQSRLHVLDGELAETREMALARQQLRIAQRRLSQRVVDVHAADEPDTLAIALGAGSLDGLIEPAALGCTGRCSEITDASRCATAAAPVDRVGYP